MGTARDPRLSLRRTVLAENLYADAATSDAGELLAEINERVRPYADRSAWDGLIVRDDELLDNADFNTEPFLWVEGEDWFDALEHSPPGP